MKLVERDKDVFFLYYPNSTPQPDGGPSAWGAAALISAVDEGLAGIVDADVCYRKLSFSPRFTVTPYTELRYFTGYEKSGKIIDVRYKLKDEGMRYDVTAPSEEIIAHILLPKEKSCREVYVNGEQIIFNTVTVAQSDYVDFTVPANGRTNIEVYFN